MSHPLLNYAIGVVVALAVMLAVTRAVCGEARFKTALIFALGFWGDAVYVHQGQIDGCILVDHPDLRQSDRHRPRPVDVIISQCKA